MSATTDHAHENHDDWFDADDAPTAPHRALVWIDAELDDPAAWWSATRLAYLPAGVSFTDLPEDGDVDVTISCDVSSLASGLNELSQRYDASWSAHHPETLTVNRASILRPYRAEEVGRFRTERDLHRLTHDLPRAVVRSNTHDHTTRTRDGHYQLRHPWPAGTFTQGGKARLGRPATPDDIADPDGFVGESGYAVVDAGYFIEAVPPHPSTLLRGEGPTFADAEDALWSRWTRITNCDSPTGTHVYETRGYRNGCGICAHCGLFSTGVFDLAAIGSVCVVCGVGTYWCHVPGRDENGLPDPKTEDLVCQQHAPPDYLTVAEDLHDHAEGRGPAPDTTWFADHLPDGFTAADAPTRMLRAAIDQGRRNWVDRLIAKTRTGDNP